MEKGFRILKIEEYRGCGKTVAATIAIQSAIIEDQIAYYKKEFLAAGTEAKRQCDIAIELSGWIMKLEDELCQMKK